ncbi:hypothetical protein ACCS66_03870 [Rhizobium ruizarguesonis]
MTKPGIGLAEPLTVGFVSTIQVETGKISNSLVSPAQDIITK